MVELWTQSPSYPKHEVSNTGKVRVRESSRRSNIGIELKQKTDKDGYKSVAINRTTVRVHRMVAEAFIPNPNNNEVAHHKDNSKDNNDASNLEWTSISFNTAHAYSIGAIKSPNRNPVAVYIGGKFFGSYDSGSELARNSGVSRGEVERCLREDRLLLGLMELKEIPKTEKTFPRKIFNKEFPKRGFKPFKVIYNEGFEEVFDSIKQAALLWGISEGQVGRILKGRHRDSRGIESVEYISKAKYLSPFINW